MAVVIEGPNSGGDSEGDWEGWLSKLTTLLATEESSSIGASIQASGNFGLSASMIDQVIGKVGPMIGKWDPEASCRMIQEF